MVIHPERLRRFWELLILRQFFFNNFQTIKKINKKKLELACYSALQKHLSEIKIISVGFKKLNIDSTEVKLFYRLNGLFYEVTAQSRKNKDSVKVVYLCGLKSNSYFENAVVISRPNLSASVAGNTNIIGNILATSDIFTLGTIYGLTSHNNDFIDGNIKINENIPILKNKYIALFIKVNAFLY